MKFRDVCLGQPVAIFGATGEVVSVDNSYPVIGEERRVLVSFSGPVTIGGGELRGPLWLNEKDLEQAVPA